MKKGWEEVTDEDRNVLFNITPHESMSVIHDGKNPDDELAGLAYVTRGMLKGRHRIARYIVETAERIKERIENRIRAVKEAGERVLERFLKVKREKPDTGRRVFLSTNDLDINLMLDRPSLVGRRFSGVHTGMMDADRKLIQKAFKRTIKKKKKELKKSRKTDSAGIIHSLEREIASLERQLKE